MGALIKSTIKSTIMMMFMALLILACIPLASGDKTELAPAVTPSMANLPVQVPLPFPSESSMAGLMPTNGTGAIEAIEKQMLQFIRNMRKTPAELLNGEKTFNFLQGDAHSTVNNSLIQGSKPFWWYPFAATAYPVKGVATDANKMAALATMHNDYMAYSYIWMVMCFMIEQGLTAGGFVPKVPESAKQPSAPGFPPYAAGAWPFGPYPGAASNLEKKKLSAKKSAKVAHFHHKVSDPWDKDTEDNKDSEDTVFLQKEAAFHPLYTPGTAPAMDLATIAKYFKAAGIYWDMIANLNIMACMGYLFPQAIKELTATGGTQPTAHKYVIYVKLVAFYYWAGVQYWVDILNIYDIYTPADKKQVYGTWIDWSNKYALRCKSYAFYMYGYDNMFLAATKFSTPATASASVIDSVKVLLHTRSQNLVMTVLSFSYQQEFYIPASGFYANSYSLPMVLEFAYDQLLIDYIVQNA